jgi:hypothetical protein
VPWHGSRFLDRDFIAGEPGTSVPGSVVITVFDEFVDVGDIRPLTPAAR